MIWKNSTDISAAQGVSSLNDLTTVLIKLFQAKMLIRDHGNLFEIAIDKIRSFEASIVDLDSIDPKFWKKFYDEIMPMVKFLQTSNEFKQYKKVKFCFGNQSYDAVLFKYFKRYYIEVCSAYDGHMRHFMLKHLHDWGHAPMRTEGGVDSFKEALKQGVEVTDWIATEVSENLNAVVSRTQSVLDKKCANAKYYEQKPIDLLLYVDDGDIINRMPFEDLTSRIIIPPKHPFKRIWILGSVSVEIKQIY